MRPDTRATDTAFKRALPKEKLEAFNAAETTIWYTQCPKCGTRLRGSMAQLMAHQHPEA
jgi:phage terminase large subunit GpA-like protein